MERWITAHRIGIAAYLGQGLGGASKNQERPNPLRIKLGGLLKQYLVDSLSGDAQARHALLLGLPPSVMHLLDQALRNYSNLVRRELLSLPSEIRSAIRRLNDNWEESTHSPLSYSQSW